MLLELALGSLLFSSEATRAAEGYEATCTGRPQVYFRLLEAPLVQADLNLTPEQHLRIASLQGEYDRRTLAARQTASSALRDQPFDTKARGRLQLELFDLDQTARASLESILSDSQEARLTQIFRQLLGPELFKHADYLLPLELSAAQSAAAGKTMAEFRYRMERAVEARGQDQNRGDFNADRQLESRTTFERRKREFEHAAIEAILAGLDSRQNAQLANLYGAPLDRHELRRQMRAASQARVR
jgi:hypothetical protein